MDLLLIFCKTLHMQAQKSILAVLLFPHSNLASQSLYYKKALEKLGVEMQVIRHGKFKAAVEPFLLEKMSPENKEQINSYSPADMEKLLMELVKKELNAIVYLGGLLGMIMGFIMNFI